MAIFSCIHTTFPRLGRQPGKAVTSMNVKKVVYVEMTEEAAKDLGLDPADLVSHLHDSTVELMPIEVDDESLVESIHREQNRIAKQRERETRCWVDNGKGKLIRCEGKCSECSHTRKPIFSIEASLEQGVDIADENDEYAIIEMKMTVRKLIKKVRKTDALAADVCELFIRYEGNKEPIEKELGITRSVLDKKLKKIARENAEFNIFV